ncbi:MAG: phytanoyl-CoA dioxygenase family protein [Thermoanaerobaculia bacterium]|nr:phytanoyl-CoA dioxygenase family protein [Thermoanaerobaculia bacterium]
MPTIDMWNHYERDGFLHLGQLLPPEEVEALKQRADDLAQGRVSNDKIAFQLDTGGAYEELPGIVDHFERPTLLYRKIQGLEHDDLFVKLVLHPVCLEICAHEYGAHAPLALFRAMIMNKPAGQGTYLPWHQDGGDVWKLDRDPLVTIWVALDPATRENGCMEVIPESHRLGLLTKEGSNLRPEDVERHCSPERIHSLEVPAGHGVLLHNWLIHRSGVNPSSVPRRAMTACYLDGRTVNQLTGTHFPTVHGDPPDVPHYRQQLDLEHGELRKSLATAADYARSLEAELERVRGEYARLEESARASYAALEASARAHIANLERELASVAAMS